jgi:DNA integrity scanning protein DisA with diadenylate cyclase activity
MEEILLTPRDRQTLLQAGIKPEGAIDFRQPISNSVKTAINEALQAVPEGKRGALLVISDGQGTRAHLASRIGDNWKVAASAGVRWNGEINGLVAVQGAW